MVEEVSLFSLVYEIEEHLLTLAEEWNLDSDSSPVASDFK
jgi:hypothetical protein